MRIPSRAIELGSRPSAGAEVLRDQDIHEDDESIFDVRREITKNDIEKIIIEYLPDIATDTFASAVTTLISARPDLRKKLVSNNWFDFCLQELSRWKAQGNIDLFLEFAFYTIRMFPDRRNEIRSSLDEVFEDVVRIIEERKKRNKMFLKFAMFFFVVYPERRGVIKVEDVFDKAQSDLKDAYNNDWFRYAEVGMFLKILFPDYSHATILNETALAGIREEFEKSRTEEGSWLVFVELALALNVLCSERAEIDATGQLVITPRASKLMSEPAPLPERPMV
jgi:hypothetical protein